MTTSEAPRPSPDHGPLQPEIVTDGDERENVAGIVAVDPCLGFIGDQSLRRGQAIPPGHGPCASEQGHGIIECRPQQQLISVPVAPPIKRCQHGRQIGLVAVRAGMSVVEGGYMSPLRISALYVSSSVATRPRSQGLARRNDGDADSPWSMTFPAWAPGHRRRSSVGACRHMIHTRPPHVARRDIHATWAGVNVLTRFPPATTLFSIQISAPPVHILTSGHPGADAPGSIRCTCAGAGSAFTSLGRIRCQNCVSGFTFRRCQRSADRSTPYS